GEGWNTWMLTDIAAGPGLTVTGTINLSGTFGTSQELSKIQILAGGSPVPVPAAVWLFGSGLLGLVGMARHKKA
ncbi:MAG: VPLPA-CTERM sorting domain-containing protein, partial [Gammaproteobacteria bacterium]